MRARESSRDRVGLRPRCRAARRPARRSAPARPKFRTCVEMSGARKKNVVLGVLLGAASRGACARSSASARGPRLSAIRISPSAGEISAPSLSDRLMPLYGRADVVEHRLDLARRDHLADGLLDLARSAARVSSMRVPGGAAHVQLDEARVDAREEVAPDQRQERERDARRTRTNAADERRRDARAPSASSRRSQSRRRSKPRLNAANSAPDDAARRRRACPLRAPRPRRASR